MTSRRVQQKLQPCNRENKVRRAAGLEGFQCEFGRTEGQQRGPATFLATRNPPTLLEQPQKKVSRCVIFIAPKSATPLLLAGTVLLAAQTGLSRELYRLSKKNSRHRQQRRRVQGPTITVARLRGGVGTTPGRGARPVTETALKTGSEAGGTRAATQPLDVGGAAQLKAQTTRERSAGGAVPPAEIAYRHAQAKQVQWAVRARGEDGQRT